MTALDLTESYIEAQKRRAAGDVYHYANLVILRCSVRYPQAGEQMSDPSNDWTPLLPSAVPDWLKDAEIIGRMVGGELVGRVTEPDAHDPLGSAAWYRAEQLPMPETNEGVLKLQKPHKPKIIQAAEIIDVDESKPDGVRQLQ